MAKREIPSRGAQGSERLLLLGAIAASLIISLALNVDWLRSARHGLRNVAPVAGNIAERDVRSPADLTIVDREATDAERKVAMENAPVVYDFRPGAGATVRARLHSAFEAAQAAREAWNPLTDMLALQCIAPGMPNANMNPYPIEFVDEGEQIRLNIEEWEARRVIDMASTEIPADAPRSLLGYSIGRWEGATLVIETGRVDSPYLDDEGTPMSGEAHITERYTVSSDGSRLDYTVTVTDPPNIVGAAVWDAHWTWVPGTVIRPFECESE